jgi:predicted GIY-YIG superfamily endonuclease
MSSESLYTVDMAWIYFLIDPRTGDVRYIGYSYRPETRLTQHINESLSAGNSHKLRWIRKLARLGLAPELVLIEQVERGLAPSREIEYIALAKTLGWSLVNGTAGGDGVTNPSIALRKKIGRAVSASYRSRSLSDETRRKLIASARRGGHAASHSPASEETRRKISESQKRRHARNKSNALEFSDTSNYT